MGAQTKRSYYEGEDKTKVGYDYFDFISGEYTGFKTEYIKGADDNNKFYYKYAFANYWKRGVEKQMKKNGKPISDYKIKRQMEESLPSLNQIAEYVVRSNGNVNLRKLLQQGDISGEYAKMFVDTFTKDAVSFATLFDAMMENQQKTDLKIYEVGKDNQGNLNFSVERINK